MIIRPDYIRAVTPFIDVPLVKILAGVRRSGKSTIFDMLKEELISRGIPKEQIISRKYTEMDVDGGFDAKAMYQELKDRIVGQQKFYLFGEAFIRAHKIKSSQIQKRQAFLPGVYC